MKFSTIFSIVYLLINLIVLLGILWYIKEIYYLLSNNFSKTLDLSEEKLMNHEKILEEWVKSNLEIIPKTSVKIGNKLSPKDCLYSNYYYYCFTNNSSPMPLFEFIKSLLKILNLKSDLTHSG
jgi:hypothetical protein